MSKTLLHRLFGVGRIPRGAKDRIRTEGVVLQDEGIGGSVTFKRYRAPGRYHGWKRTWFTGSVVLTRQHFLAFTYSRSIIGVAWNDGKVQELDVRLEGEDTLCVAFDAAAFDEEASGGIEVRLSTPRARRFLERIEQLSGRRSHATAPP